MSVIKWKSQQTRNYRTIYYNGVLQYMCFLSISASFYLCFSHCLALSWNIHLLKCRLSCFCHLCWFLLLCCPQKKWIAQSSFMETKSAEFLLQLFLLFFLSISHKLYFKDIKLGNRTPVHTCIFNFWVVAFPGTIIAYHTAPTFF